MNIDNKCLQFKTYNDSSSRDKSCTKQPGCGGPRYAQLSEGSFVQRCDRRPLWSNVQVRSYKSAARAETPPLHPVSRLPFNSVIARNSNSHPLFPTSSLNFPFNELPVVITKWVNMYVIFSIWMKLSTADGVVLILFVNRHWTVSDCILVSEVNWLQL